MWTNETFLYLHSVACQRSQRGFHDLTRIQTQAKLASSSVPSPLTILLPTTPELDMDVHVMDPFYSGCVVHDRS